MGAIGKLTDCSDAQQNAEKGSLPASAFSFTGSPSAGLGARSPSSLCLKRLKPEPRCQCSSVLPYAPCISEPTGKCKCSCRCSSLTLLYTPTPHCMVTVPGSDHLLADGDGVVGQAQACEGAAYTRLENGQTSVMGILRWMTH